MKRIFLVFLTAFVAGCTDPGRNWSEPAVQFDGTAYRPVYMTAETVREIAILPARGLSEPGKIYWKEPYLFVNEKGKGIHIIDNTDPSHPENISFIAIPANYDMAVRGNWLYADNLTDLLVFDMSNPRDVKLAKRMEKTIPAYEFPPYTNVYFECADASKGVVVGWEKVRMESQPRCRR